jgi:hypothetical protein
MDTNLLLGTWRTNRVHYHSDYFETFGENDHWQQLQFAPAGKVTEVTHHNGNLHPLPYPVYWSEKKGQIEIRKVHRWAYLVKELTDNTLVVQSVDTGITWFYDRVDYHS